MSLVSIEKYLLRNYERRVFVLTKLARIFLYINGFLISREQISKYGAS